MGDVYSKTVTSTNPKVMYNGGLRTRNIDTIVIHHNATTNKDVAMNTWVQGSGAYTSAHYEITDNDIIGCVGENYVAWHSGGTGGNDVPRIPDINNRSIGIEHVNSAGAPDWKVSDKTLRNSAKLIADICKRYGLPINRDTIKLHREVTATACPGGLDINKLVAYAQEAAGQKVTVEAKTAFVSFQDNPVFTAYKAFRVDKMKFVNGLWQIVDYELAGSKTLDWTLNGIPLDILDNVTRGNYDPTRVGDMVKLMDGYNYGSIDAFDKQTNGVGIMMGEYGLIWFDADGLMKL